MALRPLFTTAFLAALFLGQNAQSVAQTVTVDPTGTANGTTIFNNLQDAVDSFVDGAVNATADPGNTIPNIINVRNDHGPVTGKVVAIGNNANPAAQVLRNIVGDVTIQGVDASGNPALAVFAGDPLTNAEQNIRTTGNGARPRLAWTQAGNLTIRHIAFIPGTVLSTASPESFIAVKAPAINGVNPQLNIENCVFTSNDGTGNPITTTGAPADDANLGNAGVISLPQGSAGIWMFSRGERGDMIVNVKDSVFASIVQFVGADSRFEAFKAWVSGTAGQNVLSCFLNIKEGNVFANLDGNIAQVSWGAYITMQGTPTKPIIVRDFLRAGAPGVVWLYFANDGDQQPVGGQFEHVRFYNCPSLVISEGGTLGTRTKAYINFVKNCIFVNCGDAITLGSGATLDVSGLIDPTVLVDNCVFHNVGSGSDPAAIYGASTFARNLDVTNSVFTDSDANEVGMKRIDATSGIWNVASTTFSLAGDYPIQTPTAGTGVITLDASVNNDAVTYLNTTDVYSPDFFKVQGSNVQDWAIY